MNVTSKPRTLKVPRTVLLGHVRSRREDIVAKYEQDLAEYVAAKEVYLVELKKALTKALEQISKGNLPERVRHYSDRVEIELEAAYPKEPTLNSVQVDADIKLLELSADETVTVGSHNGWGEYL